MCTLLFVGIPFSMQSQVEDSASISAETNTDEFQEAFFSALKEKAVGNFDRALNLFLECRSLSDDKPVVDYQLSLLYLQLEQPEQAYQSAISAYKQDKTQFWFLQAVVDAAIVRGMTSVQLLEVLQGDGLDPGPQLALAYFRRDAFREALNVIEEVPSSPLTENLKERALDSLNSKPGEEKEDDVRESPAMIMKNRLRELITQENYQALGTSSEQALEEYPAEPYFYYARGVFLAHNEQYENAAALLEEGLLYLLQDRPLEEAFYRQLADIYTALGDLEKAGEYLKKIE